MENEEIVRVAKLWLGEDGIVRIIHVPGAQVTLAMLAPAATLSSDRRQWATRGDIGRNACGNSPRQRRAL